MRVGLIGYGAIGAVVHRVLAQDHASAAQVAGVLVRDAARLVRAPEGGILHTMRRTGDRVGRQEVIGVVADPLGTSSVPVVSDDDGIIVGRSHLPIVNKGDALFHVARSKPLASIKAKTETVAPLLDEDEIV